MCAMFPFLLTEDGMNTIVRYFGLVVVLLLALLFQGCASTQPGKDAGSKMHALYSGAVQSIPTPQECGVASASDPTYVQCIRNGARSVAAVAQIAHNVAAANRAAVETETYATKVNIELAIRPIMAIGRFGADTGAAYANFTINRRAEDYNESQEAIAKSAANSTSTIRLPDGPLADSHDSINSDNNLTNQQQQQQQQRQDQTAQGGNASSDSSSGATSVSGATSTSGAVANPVNIATGGQGGAGGNANSDANATGGNGYGGEGGQGGAGGNANATGGNSDATANAHGAGGDCVNCGGALPTTN